MLEISKIFNDLGIDGLKHTGTNIAWTVEQRFELVQKFWQKIQLKI